MATGAAGVASGRAFCDWHVLDLYKLYASNMIYCACLWSLDIRSNEPNAKDLHPVFKLRNMFDKVVTRRGWH